jgi:hypothetical protein
MFNSYEMTRALVAERQGTLRHEARQHRLARGARRARRTSGGTNVTHLVTPARPASSGASLTDHRAA